MPTEEELATFIVDYARKGGPITGSTLGGAVIDEYGQVDFRTRFGGLKRFIETYTNGSVRWRAKKGGDDIYGYTGPDELLPRELEVVGQPGTSRAPTDSASIWSQLTNPKYRSRVLVDLDVMVFRPGTDDLASGIGTVFIEGLTIDDYKNMATQFLSHVPDDLRADFERTIERDDFWASWSALMFRQQRSGLYSRWGKYRVEKIAEIIAQRLKAAGASDEKIPQLLQVLERSRQDSRNKTEAVTTRKGAVPSPRRQNAEDGGASDPRSIAHRIIDRLSPQQLRQIWVPLGAVIDTIGTDDAVR